MYVIEKETIGEAWREAFKYIMNNGKRIQDEKQELLEILHINLVINNPNKSDAIMESQTDSMKDWMENNFTQIIKIPELNDCWSYGWRLFNFNGINQLEWIINKLKRKPESKSATISMLQGAGIETYIPCVSLLDFKIRDEVLLLTVTCRSLDFGKKAIHNFTNLAAIARKVANKIGLNNTRLILQIISAHIYRDDVRKNV